MKESQALIASKANQEKWRRWREAAGEEAVREFPTIETNPVLIAGIMLYWGEGDSDLKYPLRLSNTNPRMINLYVRFLKEVLHIPEEKIRINILLYPDLSEARCKKFWKSSSGLKERNFTKNQRIQGRHRKRRLSYGVCMITVSSKWHKIKVLKWIELFSRKFTIALPVKRRVSSKNTAGVAQW